MAANIPLEELIKFPSEEIDDGKRPAIGRSLSRQLALQALYQNFVNPQDLAIIESQFISEGWLNKSDTAWFKELITEVTKQEVELEELFVPFLDRNIKMINPIERVILRLAAYELKTQIQIPYRVVLNEAIELSKNFGAQDSHKYINGVLDKLAQDLRPLELSKK